MRKPVSLARPYVSVVHFLKCKTWMVAYAVHKGVPNKDEWKTIYGRGLEKTLLGTLF